MTQSSVATSAETTSRSIFGDSQAEELAKSLLLETREEIARADNKASTVLGFTSVAVSILVAGVLASDWRPQSLGSLAEILWWTGVAVAALGVVFAALCIFPRCGQSAWEAAPRYFADVANLQSQEDLNLRLNLGLRQNDERIVNQVFVTSRIAKRKYSFLQYSLVSLGVSALLVIVAVLI